jgi:competence protein ComFC
MQPFSEVVKAYWNAALGLLYPEICQLCGQDRAGPDDSYICQRCRDKVRHVEPPFCERCGFPFEGAITTPFECSKCRDADWQFSYARSAVIARDPILELIHRYKYQQALWFEPFLAQLLVERAKAELSAWNCIVPVPLHPTKKREREFNQAERLARRLSEATGLPLKTRWIRRPIHTRTQTLLSREERLQNVRRAFAPRRGVRLNGERVVLVDDVFTTGATTGACARVLREMGAAEVCVWTLARGI